MDIGESINITEYKQNTESTDFTESTYWPPVKQETLLDNSDILKSFLVETACLKLHLI